MGSIQTRDNLSQPTGLTYDASSHTLYWADPQLHAVSLRCNCNFSEHFDYRYLILLLTDIVMSFLIVDRLSTKKCTSLPQGN
jgi:hypothetical protein